ncbi:hypothetical protein MUK42_04280 [Musa troglodytarum]|uniref:Uncharacterized protein n=1 Tax=Musa troglodytarum TaxID=320322 RepID=A0A9E7GLS1_9LILI|nr:hypothetical protein MUK42_04280 [Musa troglodytarum]
MSRFSGLIPAGNLQSKPCASVAAIGCTILIPRLIPEQTLRPAPKGMISKSFPLTSMLSCRPPGRNLAGRNSSGSGHDAGSWVIAQMLTSSVAPLGTE